MVNDYEQCLGIIHNDLPYMCISSIHELLGISRLWLCYNLFHLNLELHNSMWVSMISIESTHTETCMTIYDFKVRD